LRALGVAKLGNVALDGSKIKANASKHRALSYGHIKKLEAQLKEEVAKLLALAEAADNEKIPDGMNLPDEIARREDRLTAIAVAESEIEARAQERFAQEQAEYKAKLAKRETQAADSGKSPRGKEPIPPVEGARDKDQINLTDEESRILKTAGGGFEQCYNGQIAVDMDSLPIVKTGTVQATSDKQQTSPMLEQLATLPEALGKPTTRVADTGYYTEANVKACGKHSITPLIAVSREAHHPDPMERFTEPPPLSAGAAEVEVMRHALKTKAGRAIYAQRKCTVEPVIGIVKSVLGFRQFMLRGLENAKGELNWVAMAWNMKRMFVLVG
jgi:hypothetical protein